jgi:RimJ/RimL family protein N-acetyltransferase
MTRAEDAAVSTAREAPGPAGRPAAGSITGAGVDPPSEDAGPAPAWTRSRRLALREFYAGDHDALLQMHRDPRLRAHLIDDYPLHLSPVVHTFLARMAPFYRRHEGLGIWHASLAEGDAGTFVGWFNLMPIAERPGEVEIGSRLLPAHWGGGLAVEGGELLLDHAFDTLGLPHVWGICHPDNRAAQAVLGALGFDPAGVLPYDGVPASHHRIELNAWRELRNLPRGRRLRRALRTSPAPAQAGAPHTGEGHEAGALPRPSPEGVSHLGSGHPSTQESFA